MGVWYNWGMEQIPTIEDLGRLASTASGNNYNELTEEQKVSYNRIGVAVWDEAVRLCHHIASQKVDVSRFGSASGSMAQKVIVGCIASLTKELSIEVQA